MERKATFAVKNSTSHSSDHNSRKSIPNYLIETNPSFTDNHYEKLIDYENDMQFRELAKSIYKKKIKQKMQDKQVNALIKETVVSAKPEHKSDDIKALFKALREHMGGGYHLLELSGHFDEGHFERIEDGWETLTYYPGKDILFKSDGNWYIKNNELEVGSKEQDFDIQVDISNFKKVYNIHWHCKFTHMNLQTGKTARFKKKQVSGEGRLKFVANFLGLRYEPNEKISREQSVGSVKDQYHMKRQEKYRQMQEEEKRKKKKLEEYTKIEKKHTDAIMKHQQIYDELHEFTDDLHTYIQKVGQIAFSGPSYYVRYDIESIIEKVIEMSDTIYDLEKFKNKVIDKLDMKESTTKEATKELDRIEVKHSPKKENIQSVPSLKM